MAARTIFAAEAIFTLFIDFHPLLPRRTITNNCNLLNPYLLIELLSSLVVLKDSLVEVFLERIFILSMNDDPVLWLSNFLAANKGTALAKVLRVGSNNVFRVDDLISIAIVDGCSDI